MTLPPSKAPEMTREVPLDRIGPDGLEMSVEANAGERAALAQRFGLVRIDDLHATVRLEWLDGGRRLRLRGRVGGHVVQTCVVSLEPVDNLVDEPLEIVFERENGGQAAREIVVSTSDETEPLPGDPLDIGEIVAEEFALSLDPYPRRPDADQIGASGAESGESATRGPFQGLERLKRNT